MPAAKSCRTFLPLLNPARQWCRTGCLSFRAGGHADGPVAGDGNTGLAQFRRRLPCITFLIALAVFFIHSTSPVVAESDDIITVWSATLTVKAFSAVRDGVGCMDGASATYACNSTLVLSDIDFTYDGVDYEVERIFLNPTPRYSDFDFGFNKAATNLSQSGLTLHVNGRRFALADATLVSSDEGTDAIARWYRPGLSWSVNQQVSLSLKAPAPAREQAPGPIQNLVLSTTDTADSITVTWDPPDTGGRPDQYIVYAGSNALGREGGQTKILSNPNQTSVTFNNMTPGKIYQVWVRAKNTVGKGTRSRGKIRLNSNVLPGPVTNLDVRVTHERAMVQWDSPETGGYPWTYIVHLKREGAGSGRIKTPRAKESPMVTFEGLTSGEYKVWVRAKNKGGKGERIKATFTIP